MHYPKKGVEFLIEKGYDKQYGARPLARAIQNHIEDALAAEIIKNTLKKDAKINFDWDGKSETLKLKIAQAKEA